MNNCQRLLDTNCGYYHLALASTNIYNEKYEIYKTESNAKGRRDSKE